MSAASEPCPTVAESMSNVTGESVAAQASVRSATIALLRPGGVAARVNRMESTPGATPSLDRVLAFIRSQIGIGLAFPTPAAIAGAMGWVNLRSARDALRRLELMGLIRRVGAEARDGPGRGRVILELTNLGAAPRAKSCRGCSRERPARAFRYDRGSADGLAPLCTSCGPPRPCGPARGEGAAAMTAHGATAAARVSAATA